MKENISLEHCLQWRNILPLDAHESPSSRSSSIFVAVDVDANKSLQLTTSYDETALPSFQKYCSTVRVRTTLTSASTSFAKRRASLGPLTAATDPVIPSRMRGLLFIVFVVLSGCGLWLVAASIALVILRPILTIDGNENQHLSPNCRM